MTRDRQVDHAEAAPQRALAGVRRERDRLRRENAGLRAALETAVAWGAELGRRLVATDPDLDTMTEPKGG